MIRCAFSASRSADTNPFQHIVAQAGAGSFHSDSLSSSKFQDLFIFIYFFKISLDGGNWCHFSFLTAPNVNHHTWFFFSSTFPLNPTGCLFFNQHEGTLGRSRSPQLPLKKLTRVLAPEVQESKTLSHLNNNNNRPSCCSLWILVSNSSEGEMEQIPPGALECLTATNRSSALSWAWGTGAESHRPFHIYDCLNFTNSLTYTLACTDWYKSPVSRRVCGAQL